MRGARRTSALLLCGLLAQAGVAQAAPQGQGKQRGPERAVDEPAPARARTPEGWTKLAPSSDTRTVYVSSARGKDTHDGLSPARPKRSIAAAKALLRHGFPDWLLLERGGVWSEGLGQWKASGRSPSEPMVVATYGDDPARPLLETEVAGGIWTHRGGGSPERLDHLALVGLHLRPRGHEGGGDCVGARLLLPSAHVLIEDCVFEGFGTNLVLQGYGGRHADFELRRSIVVDAWTVHATGGHSQGLYADAIDGLLIEENVFDHDGWNESVAGAGADIFSHDLYVDNGNSAVVVQGNVIANASSHGLQLRPGGVARDNLFFRNSIALSVGGGNAPNAGGVTADVRDNVILDAKDIDAEHPRGWGLWFANVSSGCVACNLIAGNVRGSRPVAITLDGAHVGDEVASIGVHELVLEDNVVHAWRGGIVLKGPPDKLRAVEFRGNDFQEPGERGEPCVHADAATREAVRWTKNRAFGGKPPPGAGFVKARASYPDPDRDLATYARMRELGESAEDLLAKLRARPRGAWPEELTARAINAYVRAGFGME